MFIAEHNLPFLAADHFNKLCKVMFPDSKIAQGFACCRTKTVAIVKHALAPVFNSEVVQSCRTSPFTLLCDSGNDQTDQKYFWNHGKVLGCSSTKASYTVSLYASVQYCHSTVSVSCNRGSI